ncbi:PD40 domain-containing protein [Geofilum rhodophaeum]|uniref:PD40 domain-containing protein n=1 Tax=Geofilum rhodophaeum TaxID=1965019 RepID=UPI000B521D0B|nr:PD40 domain-containing protein [Geofilum rhodophaeum]
MIKKAILLLFLPFLLLLPLQAQTSPSATEALSLYNTGKYAEAATMYRHLLERNNRDAQLNYYYALSLIQLKERPDEALQRMKLAAVRPPEPEVHYHLGYLYQRVYEVEMARTHYQRYLDLSKTGAPFRDDAERGISDCAAAEQLINKHFDIEVLQKDTIPFEALKNHYGLSRDAGQLLKAGDFFRVGVDPNQIIFRTERGNEVFFPLLDSNGNYDLYKIVRLIDAWTEAEKLRGPINSEHNDLYPFLLTDGTTMYFSSDRPGGMGGLDIYQSFLDPESGSFSEPANLGPPFNSPDDDFLLVPDIYAGKAWFATNRGVSDTMAVVTQIVWDHQVVRNLTQDVNQIKVLAKLPVSSTAVSRTSSTVVAGKEAVPQKKDELFHFSVNDTLIYSRYEHFQSSEALSAFRRGYLLSQQRDSLTRLMQEKRQAYSQSYHQDELKRLIDQIVDLEKKTYGLEDQIEPHYRQARQKELEYIRQLLRDGRYAPRSSARRLPKGPPSELEQLLTGINAGDLTFYADDEFLQKREDRQLLYETFYTANEIPELQRADSLTVWAGLLNLESGRLLEESRLVSARPISMRDRMTKDIEEEMSREMEDLIFKARKYRENALALYEKALDYKYDKFYQKALELSGNSVHTGSEELTARAQTHYEEAEKGIARLEARNPEQLERLLALKKQGVDMLEGSLTMQMAGEPAYTANQRGSATTTNTRFLAQQGVVSPSYPAIHKGEASPPADIVAGAFKAPDQAVQTTATERPLQPDVSAAPKASSLQTPAVHRNDQPVYKVQIGVFRNTPNATALAKIPAISQMPMPDGQASKYFSGEWTSYEAAKASVEAIREAGFPGAFVVAFLNGEQIPLEAARARQ